MRRATDRFEKAVVSYAGGPSRRGFLGMASVALAALVAGDIGAVGARRAYADQDCTVQYPAQDLDNCPNKRHHPGHTPTYNGCGPENSYKSYFIPNKWGSADFTASCNGHDVCYGTCGKIKEMCDFNFLKGNIEACQSAYSADPIRLSACSAVAAGYFDFVFTKGQGPFDEAQKEDCECCVSSKAYCTCTKTCYVSATACVENCPSGLGCFAEQSCGAPPPGACGT